MTADCGSTSHDAADLARKLGVDLIITDHHQCPPVLPDAFALVNPWRPDCGYPCDYLCGAGVAFKLIQALADALLPDGRAAMEPLLDLVAVATVADIMPLLGENRRLVLAGLRIMNAFPRPGVRALIETSGLKPGDVDAAALGFRVAPRVNAAGRLDDPNLAYRLLMSESYEEAFALAGRDQSPQRGAPGADPDLYARWPTSWCSRSSSRASTRWCAAATTGQAASSAWSPASSPRPTTARRWSTAATTAWSAVRVAASPASTCWAPCRRATTSSIATAAIRPPLASVCRPIAWTS